MYFLSLKITQPLQPISFFDNIFVGVIIYIYIWGENSLFCKEHSISKLIALPKRYKSLAKPAYIIEIHYKVQKAVSHKSKQLEHFQGYIFAQKCFHCRRQYSSSISATSIWLSFMWLYNSFCLSGYASHIFRSSRLL